MTAPVSFLLAFIGLIVSAKTRLNAVIFGQPVSIPWIGLIFVLLILALVVVVLCLIHAIMQNRPVRESRPVHVITSPEGTR